MYLIVFLKPSYGALSQTKAEAGDIDQLARYMLGASCRIQLNFRHTPSKVCFSGGRIGTLT